jgi:hypothetical protein
MLPPALQSVLRPFARCCAACVHSAPQPSQRSARLGGWLDVLLRLRFLCPPQSTRGGARQPPAGPQGPQAATAERVESLGLWEQLPDPRGPGPAAGPSPARGADLGEARGASGRARLSVASAPTAHALDVAEEDEAEGEAEAEAGAGAEAGGTGAAAGHTTEVKPEPSAGAPEEAAQGVAAEAAGPSGVARGAESSGELETLLRLLREADSLASRLAAQNPEAVREAMAAAEVLRAHAAAAGSGATV